MILKRKKEWFIQSEVAHIYKEAGEHEKSFNFAMSAINNFGDLEYKVELLVLIAELLAIKEDKELSFKHYSLSKLLRQQKEWRVPNSLSSVLAQFSFEQITIDKLPNLQKELKKYWSSFISQQSAQKQKTRLTQTGKIFKILHNDEKGADGFIKYDGNKTIYFRVKTSEEIIGKLAIGLEVQFKIFPAAESKKDKALELRLK